MVLIDEGAEEWGEREIYIRVHRVLHPSMAQWDLPPSAVFLRTVLALHFSSSPLPARKVEMGRGEGGGR